MYIRWFILSITLLSVIAACGNNKPYIMPGHSGPENAVYGYMLGLSKHDAKLGCPYVQPNFQWWCYDNSKYSDSSFRTLTIAKIHIHGQMISGRRALVAIRAFLCRRGSCRSISESLPRSVSQFQATYTSANSCTTKTIAEPFMCVEVKGRWYVFLSGSC